MKTKLFMTNSFLGILMSLVMVFGMLGSADALTLEHRSNGGNYQTVLPGGTFTISFTMRQAGSARNKPNHHSGSGVTNMPYYDEGTRVQSGYQGSGNETVDGSAEATDDVAKSTAEARYYNDKALAINIPTNFTLRKSSEVVPRQTSTTLLTERTSDTATLGAYSLHDAAAKSNLRLSSTITLTGTAAAGGTNAGADTYNIVITDVTPAADFPDDNRPTERDAITFTIYVVTPAHALPANKSTSLESTAPARSDGIYCGYKGQEPLISGAFDFTPDANAPVYYTVQGSGRLEVGSTAPKLRISNGTLTSSSASVYLTNITGTNVVTAYVAGTTPKRVIYVYTDASSPSRYPRIEVSGGDNQVGVTGGRLEDYLEVKVTDGGRRPIPGIAVRFATEASEASFIPVPGTDVYITSITNSALTTTVAEPTNNLTRTATATVPAKKASPVFVQTDRSGLAKIYYEVGAGTAATQSITATFVGEPCGIQAATFTVRKTTDRVANLEILSGNPQSATKGKQLANPLVVIARTTAGHRIPNVVIQFRTNVGTLSRHGLTAKPTADDDNSLAWGEIPAQTPNPDDGQQIYVITGADGQASVNYNVGQLVVARTIDAEIRHEPLDSSYSFAIDRVTFNINGRTSTTTPTPPTTSTPPTVTLSVPSSISGAPGSTQTLSIVSSAPPTLGGNLIEFIRAGGSAPTPRLVSGTTSTYTSALTLPNTVGNYSITVLVGATQRVVSVRVTAATTTTPAAPSGGSLRLRFASSGAPGARLPVTVTARDSDGDPAANVTIALSITNNGGTFSSASVTTATNGTATSILTLGNTPGTNYFVRATAQGYDDGNGLRVTITGATTQQPQQPQQPQQQGVGEPDSLNAYGGNNQEGSPNIRLLSPLVVEVVDANDNPVPNVRVRFRTTIGSGIFSPRTDRTDADGFAEVRFTPRSTGRIRIVASVTGVTGNAVFFVQGGELASGLVKVSGDSQDGTQGEALSNPFVVEVQDADGDPLSGRTVSFVVTAGGGSLSETSVRTGTNGRAQTLLTLGNQRGMHSVQALVSGVDPVSFSAMVEPQILVPAANRPVMYWTDGGMLYRLAEKVEPIATNITNATSWAIGGDKLYWTTTNATNPNRGTLNSANLDGSGATELKDIYGAPYEIVVDATGGKLYWTDSLNRIQQSDLAGQNIKNVVRDVSGLGTLALASGSIYWTEATGRIRSANINGGTPVTPIVASGLGEPLSLAVGGTKLYWLERATNGSGKLQRANLDGTNVEALKSFSKLYDNSLAVDTTRRNLYLTGSGKVSRRNLTGTGYQVVVSGLGNPMSIAIGGTGPAGTATQTPTTSKPTPTASNKYDVNGDGTVDSRDSDALIVALAADATDAKYDIDGNGKVDIFDLIDLRGQVNNAAAAPTLLGIKMTAVQVEHLQEQIDFLVASGDRSPAGLKTLIYLQQLIAMARPEKTQLLANYPNPFNPETWIPYELATDTDVRITIYNAQGVVIRTLQLGQQSAGYYTDRERSAYWDGRNALGEQVASGIYFYQLETDDMSSLRKMVILK